MSYFLKKALAVLVVLSCQVAADQSLQSFDVVVYGGTSGGVAAAVQIARMGKTVALVEPSRHLGGLTSGGLGATDIGNKAAIGGIAREFYRLVKDHYARDDAWKWQAAIEYRSGRNRDAEEDTMWTFEPHVAELIMNRLVQQHAITLQLNERLDLTAPVAMAQTKIESIRLESGRRLKAKVFIDATYEGDLMARAGVSYRVGREANSQYGETLNGVQTQHATHHQLPPEVDAHIVAGDATSGLLPGVQPSISGEDGQGDHHVQAYCLRMCNTQHDPNRLPFDKPSGYDEREYELLFRSLAVNPKIKLWHPIPMPNLKTDTNNNGGFSTDYIGGSDHWAESDYEQRKKIYDQHRTYQAGLMWTLANHPRVPEAVRSEFSRWGLCRDEFLDNQGWSHQLYVRESRRMVGATVMTQKHCQGTLTAAHSVGLAAYTMDSHHVQRYVDENGYAKNEGDVQVGGFPPYPIDFGSLTPKREQCTNLLVPVCLSATHIAYGSIRMEPVFMVLGQSAAIASCLAIDGQSAVQDVEYSRLREQLLMASQVLTWTAKE